MNTKKHWQPLLGGVEQASTMYNETNPNSQRIILDIVKSIIPVSSLCDLGCGPGYWLKAGMELGIEEVMGFDIPVSGGNKRNIDEKYVVECDLSKPFHFSKKYDLAVSTEVIEHIPREGTECFINNICSASDVVIFSGAIPYQGGVGHVNEHWLEHWSSFFEKNNFVCFDIIRDRLWWDSRVQYYYRQNTVIFVNETCTSSFERMGFSSCKKPKTLIHPEMMIQAVNRSITAKKREFYRDVREYYESVRGSTILSDYEPSYTYGEDDLWNKG